VQFAWSVIGANESVYERCSDCFLPIQDTEFANKVCKVKVCGSLLYSQFQANVLARHSMRSEL